MTCRDKQKKAVREGDMLFSTIFVALLALIFSLAFG
jgi:hypothetical protein